MINKKDIDFGYMRKGGIMEQAIDYKQVRKHQYEMVARDLMNKNGYEDLVKILINLMMKVDKLEGEK